MHETDRKGIDLPFFPSLKRLFSPPTCSPLNAFLPHLHPFLSLCELCGAVRVGSYEVSKQAWPSLETDSLLLPASGREDRRLVDCRRADE